MQAKTYIVNLPTEISAYCQMGNLWFLHWNLEGSQKDSQEINNVTVVKFITEVSKKQIKISYKS